MPVKIALQEQMLQGANFPGRGCRRPALPEPCGEAGSWEGGGGGSGFWFEVSESLDQSIPWGEKLREQRGPGFSLRFQSKY